MAFAVTYPGLPAPIIDEYLTFEDSTRHYAPGTEFRIGRVTMIANTGTYLVEAGARLVGIDSVNIDDTAAGHRPAHTVLLAAEIPVVEHLTNLECLPVSGSTFTAVPAAVLGNGHLPSVSFAVVP